MDYKAIIIRALLLFLSFAYAAAFKSSNISCPDAERVALLKFVGDFNRTAAADFFSSWEGKDCCKWEGVECDDRTGHVVHLDLQETGIAGSKFNPALLRLKQLSYLDLNFNEFACITIPPWIGSFKKLYYLSLSFSNFCGVVPTQLGNLSRLQFLDLSANYELVLNNTHWLSQLTSLLHIDMGYLRIANASNWLQALNMLPSVQEIHASGCAFGELPSSLKACKSLEILDLGGNMFTGRIPVWLGELSFLRILSLKSNKFVGQIPTELSNLTALQILDLSNNNLSGPIPLSFGNFMTMSIPPTNIAYHDHNNYIYYCFFMANMILDMKGREDQYGSYLLQQIMILDLSGNSLSGCIPDELTNLLGLLKFDLSSNDLTGQIPFKIGDMTQLLYLGLSRNKLSGELPSSLSNLTFLEFLSLSYNNFSGVIPTGNQMDIFTDPNIYVGNQYLCGFQINVTCGQLHRRPGSDVSANADENRKEILLICLFTIAGFAVGFWAIIGVLLVNKRFRVWWFLFVDSLYDSLYVTSKVYFARLQKKMTKTNTIDG